MRHLPAGAPARYQRQLKRIQRLLQNAIRERMGEDV
jgi:hypothetical protein